MRILKRLYARITHPTMWFRNYKCSKEVDDKFIWLIDNLDNLEFKYGIFDIKFTNGVEIWTTNRMYASPHFYPVKLNCEVLPYADTTVKFFKKLDEVITDRKMRELLK